MVPKSDRLAQAAEGTVALAPDPHRAAGYGLRSRYGSDQISTDRDSRRDRSLSAAVPTPPTLAVVLAWLLALLVLGCSVPAAAIPPERGALDDVRRDVHRGATSETRRSEERDHRELYEDDEVNLVGGLLSALFGAADHSERSQRAFYVSEGEPVARAEPVATTGQLAFTGSYLEAGLTNWSARLDVQVASALALIGSYDVFAELLPDDTIDSLGLMTLGVGLDLGSAARGLRFVPFIGYLRLHDASSPDRSGVEAGARMEVFPGPVVLRVDALFGVLGDAETRGVNLELGLRATRSLELYGGWGGRDIGDTSLFGPRVGLRWWF